MNPISGLSLYDSLNRLVTGFITSLCIMCSDCNLIKYHTEALFWPIYVICCFTAGVFFSFAIDRLAESQNIGYLKIFFYKNDMRRIRRFCKRYSVSLETPESDDDLNSYYFIYYTVQKSGLLGNVPSLETLSAYLLNLCALSFLYLFGGIIALAVTGNCCCLAWIPVLSLILLTFSTLTRHYIENKIYTSIIVAYKYGTA